MKTFTNVCAQGDVMLFRAKLTSIPENYVEVLPENGELIVTHSETSHHHVMNPTGARMFRNPDNEFESILLIDRPTSLDHKRTFDTHESIMFDAGIYHVRRQREYVADGFRKVAD